jgi:uncharacterized protein (DUF2267 family)
MTYPQMLEKVRYDGAYPTRERAEESIRLVLAALGRQLPDPERAELAARLPNEAALVLTGTGTGLDQPRSGGEGADGAGPGGGRLSGWAFVKDLAARTGAPAATTRWDTGTVFRAVAACAGPELLGRVLRRLPPGYALLFGSVDLTVAQRSAG